MNILEIENNLNNLVSSFNIDHFVLHVRVGVAQKALDRAIEQCCRTKPFEAMKKELNICLGCMIEMTSKERMK
jgi:hypothetical protein